MTRASKKRLNILLVELKNNQSELEDIYLDEEINYDNIKSEIKKETEDDNISILNDVNAMLCECIELLEELK